MKSNLLFGTLFNVLIATAASAGTSIPNVSGNDNTTPVIGQPVRPVPSATQAPQADPVLAEPVCFNEGCVAGSFGELEAVAACDALKVSYWSLVNYRDKLVKQRAAMLQQIVWGPITLAESDAKRAMVKVLTAEIKRLDAEIKRQAAAYDAKCR